MLDLDKPTFTKIMNFKVQIPKFLVKMTNTYFAKVSTVTKTALSKKKSSKKKHKVKD